MPDNLSRFERLARQAAERRKAQESAERAAENERWEQEYGSGAEEQSRRSPEFLAGPPNGCHTCYTWRRAKLGGWFWTHGAAIDPVRREVSEDDYTFPDEEFCTHPCHGPNGLWLPLIVLASC